MLTGEDKGWDAPRQHLARHWAEKQVASRASREREPSRVERNTREYIAKLSAEIIRLEEDDVVRGPQPLVAREHQASITSGARKEVSSVQLRVHDDIRAKQPQPSP